VKHRERGQSLVEGALVMLVFFALLLGIVDLSQIVFSHQALVERVRAAARWGAIHPDGGAEPVRARIVDANLKPENVLVDYRENDGVLVLHIEIVNFEAPLFAPWWPGLAHRLMDARPVAVTVPVS
jgi:hypothetical protein